MTTSYNLTTDFDRLVTAQMDVEIWYSSQRLTLSREDRYRFEESCKVII